MGYYVTASFSGYYVGDKQLPTDIAVTERPHSVCTWDGSAWVYDLAVTRLYAKNAYSNAMQSDILFALSESSNPNNTQSIMGGAFMRSDLVAYAANPDNNCPFIDGYRSITGETKAAAYASLATFPDVAAAVYGKCIAQWRLDYAAIDAATTGPDILAITYSRPF